jgi:hypothetical protein
MTYPQLLNAVAAALTPRALANGKGTVEIAESLEQARGMLTAAPRSWRIILHWEGYADHPAARQGVTYHQVATVLQAPRGLVHKPGDHLTNPLPDGTPSFSTRMEQVSEWMRAMRFPQGTNADPSGFALANSQWLDTTAGFMAHAFSWQLEAAHPGFDTNIILQFPHLNPTP